MFRVCGLGLIMGLKGERPVGLLIKVFDLGSAVL